MTYIQINIQKSRKWRGWKVRTVILWIRSLLWYQLCGFLLLSKLDRCYLHTFMSIRIKNTKQSLLLFIFNFLIFFIKCSFWKVMDRRPPPLPDTQFHLFVLPHWMRRMKGRNVAVKYCCFSWSGRWLVLIVLQGCLGRKVSCY